MWFYLYQYNINMISVWYWYGIGNISLRYYKLGLQNNLGSHPKEMCNFFEYEKTRTLMTPLDKNWEKSEIDTIWNGCIPFAPEFNKILVKVLASKTFVQSQSHLTIWPFFLSRLLTFSTTFELESRPPCHSLKISLLARVGGCLRQEWQCHSIWQGFLDDVPKWQISLWHMAYSICPMAGPNSIVTLQ